MKIELVILYFFILYLFPYDKTKLRDCSCCHGNIISHLVTVSSECPSILSWEYLKYASWYNQNFQLWEKLTGERFCT